MVQDSASSLKLRMTHAVINGISDVTKFTECVSVTVFFLEIDTLRPLRKIYQKLRLLLVDTVLSIKSKLSFPT